MSRLAQLKKKRGKNLKELQEKVEQQSGGGGKRDERVWKPKFNADKGKGTCIVRFLPPADGEPFVEQLSYSFQGPGGNFYGLARQTLNEDDPVQIAAINGFRKAKAEQNENLKKQCLKFLPKRKYFANVYVIKDEEVPDNEGKVFIWQFGPAIYKKIKEAIQPEFDDQDPMDPFDLWEGADFIIRMVGTEIPDSRTGKKVTVPNYDKASFADPSEFKGGDEDALEEIVEQTYDLSEFVDPEKFDSFEKVAKRFKDVMKKPYNWLSEEGVDESMEDDRKEKELESNVDNGDDSSKKDDEEDDDIPFEPDNKTSSEKEDDDEDDEDGEEEDPVAKFKRLANQG